MGWEPERYLQFADERLRPAQDLLARIPLAAPARVVDLGCGPGNVTRLLAGRWPRAQITGVDTSAAMLERARPTLPEARAVLAAQAMGADFGYIGSPFIATEEANAQPDYKRMIVESGAMDIVTSSLFTGVSGNYLAPSIRAAGLDPDNLGGADPSSMDLGSAKPRAWSQIWGAGQGIGAVHEVVPAGALVDRLVREYAVARQDVAALPPART